MWLHITGVKPYDGRYEFDVGGAEFTTREWGWIKRHSGYLPLTIQEGFEGGDPELFAVFAAIALRRADKIANTDVADVFDRLADAPFGSTIRLEGDDEAEEADAGPPVSSSNGSSSSSGDGSNESSATSDETPSAAGTDGSATSVSIPPRLVT